ncbi:sensor histidine kinase [Cryptosporangium arvum]|uniref:histidine kinase n=1 Tax=Cryptosporangium arvum DSM 44712 TaxID=927661 RepID=A0A011ADH2_9ACTN|nr:histidine kinase [Cryptosporangium arvum]EXG80101.1 signal transduction histidine kinase [Cryptosporangium arvum DSM 44712]
MRLGGWELRARDVASALGVFVGGLLLFKFGYPLKSWVGVATLGASAVSLLFIRSYAWFSLTIAAVALTIDWIVGPNLLTICVFANAAYVVTEQGSARVGRAMMIGSVAAVLIFTGVGLVIEGELTGVLLGVQAALFTVLPVDTAMTVRRHRQTAAAERERAEQTARLAELDQRAAVTAERTRVARDLHDLVANDLSVIALHSTAALARDDHGDTTRRSLELIRKHSVDGLAEMRHLIDVLRAGDGADSPAEARLDQLDALVERAREDGTPATLTVDGEARPLSPAVELAGYRILQEALVNAGKHAAGQPVEAVVRYRPDALTLTVENRLAAADSSFPLVGGAGLVGMTERAALVGGALDAGPREGRWRVHASIPL